MGCAQSGPTELFPNRVVPAKSSKPSWEEEATKLHNAADGVGTDEEAIISILASFKNKERQRILQAYTKLYGKDLLPKLKSELSLGYKAAVMALLSTPATYDAKSLNKALSDLDYDTIIEIICSRNQDDLENIMEEYKKAFASSLDEDLKNIKDKDLREMLLTFCSVNREYVRSRADRAAAKARALQVVNYKDLVELLSEPLGRNQLKATFDELEELTTKSMDDLIDDQYKGNTEEMRKALKAYVACTISPSIFFAKEINKSLDKFNPISKNMKVLRIIVTRSEIDLYYIKKEYLSRYTVSLSKAIQKRCQSGYDKPLRIILDIRGQYRESAVRM